MLGSCVQLRCMQGSEVGIKNMYHAMVRPQRQISRSKEKRPIIILGGGLGNLDFFLASSLYVGATLFPRSNCCDF